MPALNYLEFGYIEPPYLTATDVIYSVVEHAVELEKLGFKRLWLSEHYSPEFAWYSPEPLLSLVAGSTERIKVGWAGVLLRYHNPISLVNNFKILSTVFPGRIDLGVAAAFITDTFHKRMYDGTDWLEKLTFLQKLFGNEDVGLFEDFVEFPPQQAAPPSRWYLGTSQRSVDVACDQGMNLAISFMHPGSDYKRAGLLKEYQRRYLANHGIEGETSVLVPFLVSKEKALAEDFRARYGMFNLPPLCGSAKTVAESVSKIAEETGAQEVTLFSPLIKREQRLESVGLLTQRMKEMMEIKV